MPDTLSRNGCPILAAFLFLRLGWDYTSHVMPSRLTRFQKAGDIHFLTFSCHDRLPHLATPAAPELFEDALERMRRRYVFHVFGYVIMPEHVHLLISEPGRGMLDHAIQALKTSVSKQSVQRPFWLARYYDFNVHSEEKRVEKLRYIHRNPVTRRLVARPEEWKWSSFRHYLTGEVGPVEIESFWTVGKRAGLKMPGKDGFLASANPP
jgi:putative transposase